MTLGGRPNRQAIAAMLGQAVQLQKAGRHEDAARLYRSVLLHDPRNFDATHLLGVMLGAEGQAERALTLLERAVELDPRSGEAWNHLGNARKFLLQLDGAIAAYETAIRLNPKLVSAVYNLGLLQKQMGRTETALEHFLRVLRQSPAHLGALLSTGHVYSTRKSYAEARSAFRRVLAVQADNQEAISGVLSADGDEAHWDDRGVHCDALLRLGRSDGYRAPAFQYLSLTDDPAIHLAAARFDTRHQPNLGVPFSVRPAHDRSRLRLAYLSTDFREHPISYLLPELIERHDRGAFEVIAYSAGRDDGSDFRKRLASAFDVFHDVQHVDPLSLGRRIYDDEIDILVELNGHTALTRLPILQLRLAPVQISWLGHPGTSGAPYIDYALVDRFLVPDGQETNFSEALAFLPDTFQANDRKRPVAPETPDREAYGLPRTAFVLCCFNTTYKINPFVFDAWMRILDSVPDAVLWLHAPSEAAVENLRREALNRGVAPERLVFARREPYPVYMARYRIVDLVLDTWSYNAGTTASDALWMGAPLITLAQRSMTSRMAGSFLTALDLPELITTKVDDYVALAVRLAQEPSRLAAIKARLAHSRDHGRFFDTDRFARHMGTALVTMWERHKAGLAPQSFAVAPRD